LRGCRTGIEEKKNKCENSKDSCHVDSEKVVREPRGVLMPVSGAIGIKGAKGPQGRCCIVERATSIRPDSSNRTQGEKKDPSYFNGRFNVVGQRSSIE